MTTFRIDSTVGRPEKTEGGTRVPVTTGEARQQVEIVHGLGRVPDDIWISDKDKFCDFCTVSKDAFRHIAVFSESRVNLSMRYE